MQGEFKYRDSSGNIKTGYMALDDYRIAADHGMRASALVNARHFDADPQFGSAFEQGMKYLGVYPRGDTRNGILPTTIKAILDGTCTMQLAGTQLAGGSIVSPKAPIGGSTPASRLFFPEIVLGFIDETLQGDYAAEESAFSQLFAMQSTINSEVFTQPIINTTAPQSQDFRPIGQNQAPTQMLSITASQSSQAMGAISIGLQISEQAMRDATLDLVGVLIREQSYGARIRYLWSSLSKVVNGFPDAGQGPLTPVGFKATYDSTAAAGKITHTGYLKMLYDPDRIYSWNMILGTLDAYQAIEQRVGRPLMYDPATASYNTGNEGSYGLNPGNPQLINFTTANPRFLIVPDGVLGAADSLCLIDTRYALARVFNSSASYSATEQMVLTRSSFFRFDISEYIYRLREDALRWVDYSNA